MNPIQAANFWDSIIKSVIWLFEVMVKPALQPHYMTGFKTQMLYDAKIMLEIFFLAAGNFDLTMVGICFFLTMVLFVIYLFIKATWYLQKIVATAAKFVTMFFGFGG